MTDEIIQEENREQVKTYTKRDITKRTALALGTSALSIKDVVDKVFDVLRECMSEDRLRTRIEIRGWGVLEVKPQKPKPQARNPKTNEVVYVPARRKVHFKPGTLLKKSLSKPLTDIEKSQVT